ncbi:hypothetical protein V5799_002620 [Amblyomma americanum]|uniref:Spt20-like SEP domain-containing protein n=1 Tax=Amblyomma americanum TaxID=6943 RepID=A0AAQ4DBA8_AMBAM
MNTISTCLQQANLLIQTAKQQPGKLSREHRKEKYPSLQQRLTELYLSECNFNLRNKSLYNGSNLLGKLVSKEKLNCLVLNLYAGNEGYSLMLKTRNGTETETIRLPYEESELLQYIDNEELPPILVDLLERSQAPVFYSGCIVVEVRDHRRCLPTLGTFFTHYVLLKPTTQSVLCDVGLVARGDSNSWSLEDKLYLEAALVMATAEPLCLEPSVGVAVISNWLQHKKARFSSHMVNRMAKRHSQVAINRRKKLEQCATPPYLRAHDFIVQYRKRVPAPPLRPTMPSKQPDAWMQKRTAMPVPQNIEVEKLARVKERPELTTDNTPLVVQEYVLETEPGPGKLSRVTILQRPTDEQFIGRLYVDREGHNKGASCEFTLGTQASVTRYLNQYREIFMKEGHKSAKITQLTPGKPPVVSHVQSLYGGLDGHGEPSATVPTSKAQEPNESPPVQPAVDSRKEPVSMQGLDNVQAVGCDDMANNPNPANQASTVSNTLPVQSPEVVSLPNISIPQNVGLHNLMSLTGVNLSSAIPVPISLTMVPVTQSGVLVGAAGGLHGQIQDTQVQNIQSAVSVAQTTNVATVAPSAVIVSSGMVNPVSTVLSPASGVLSMPLTVATLGAQTLTAQLVAPALKATPQAVRSPAPVSLLQVPGGQQTLPLIGTLPRQMPPTAASNVVNNAATGSASVHNQQLQMALQKQLQLQAHSTAPQQSAAARQRSRKKSGKT